MFGGFHRVLGAVGVAVAAITAPTPLVDVALLVLRLPPELLLLFTEPPVLQEELDWFSCPNIPTENEVC